MIAEELILLYVPMPLNAAGDGPADPDETVRVEHQLWDADTNTTVFTARDEALALQLMAAWNRPTPIKPSANTGELREMVELRERIEVIVCTACFAYVEASALRSAKTRGQQSIAAYKHATDAILDLIQSERAGQVS